MTTPYEIGQVCQEHNRMNCRPCYMASQKEVYGDRTTFIEQVNPLYLEVTEDGLNLSQTK